MATLDGLSFDIFAYICHFLAPFDVISVIQTCQRLYNHHECGQRLIWIDQLRTTAAVNQSFLATSSLGSMQTSELMHAATAPFRMLRRLEEFSHRNICLEYVSRKAISIRDPHADLFLVPGGRHLILLARRGIEIWDLETNYHLANPIKNQVFLPEDATFCAVAQHSNPGKGAFRIATQNISKEKGGLYCAITVYDFLPHSIAPTTIGEIRTRARPTGPFVLRGDLLIFCTLLTIEFWNFVSGHRLTWTMPNAIQWIIADSDIVVFISNDVVQAWKIPGELHQAHSKGEALTIPAPSLDITDLEYPLGFGRYLCVSGWYSRNNLFVDHLAGDYSNIRRITLADNTISEPTGATWNLKRGLTFIAVPQYMLCEDRMVCLHTNFKDVRAFVVPQPNPVDALSLPSPLSGHTAAPLDVSISKYTPKLSFDPASGRMCCVTSDKEARVLIYDFLKQPHPSTSRLVKITT